MADEERLTHLSRSGEANMVDVGDKDHTLRSATASGSISMNRETLEMIIEGNAKKGDVISTARIAGIMAAKRTADLIPLCHPLMLSKVSVEIEPDDKLPGFQVTATARLTGQTGVEMEALTACTVTLLTIYDMAKAVDRGMILSDISVIEKSGGKSGHWKNPETSKSATANPERKGS